MHIREYRPEDFVELWRLDQECFPPDIAYSKVELMHYIRRRGTFTLVADGDGTIAGFVVAECRVTRSRHVSDAQERGVGHIITIDVHGAARRTRVGSTLMDMAEARLRQNGCAVVYLETPVNNRAAIAFYKKRRYSVLSTIPRYYGGKLDALVMGKRLDAVPNGRASAPATQSSSK